jgi:hypothetical protein
LTSGKQRFHFINPETAFRVTWLTEATADHERHLRFLLRLCPLRTIQWVNSARHRVQPVSPTQEHKVRKMESEKCFND